MRKPLYDREIADVTERWQFLGTVNNEDVYMYSPTNMLLFQWGPDGHEFSQIRFTSEVKALLGESAEAWYMWTKLQGEKS